MGEAEQDAVVEARALVIPKPPPAYGQFCKRHWSWLCQANQGKCREELAAYMESSPRLLDALCSELERMRAETVELREEGVRLVVAIMRGEFSDAALRAETPSPPAQTAHPGRPKEGAE